MKQDVAILNVFIAALIKIYDSMKSINQEDKYCSK